MILLNIFCQSFLSVEGYLHNFLYKNIPNNYLLQNFTNLLKINLGFVASNEVNKKNKLIYHNSIEKKRIINSPYNFGYLDFEISDKKFLSAGLTTNIVTPTFDKNMFSFFIESHNLVMRHNKEQNHFLDTTFSKDLFYDADKKKYENLVGCRGYFGKSNHVFCGLLNNKNIYFDKKEKTFHQSMFFLNYIHSFKIFNMMISGFLRQNFKNPKDSDNPIFQKKENLTSILNQINFVLYNSFFYSAVKIRYNNVKFILLFSLLYIMCKKNFKRFKSKIPYLGMTIKKDSFSLFFNICLGDFLLSLGYDTMRGFFLTIVAAPQINLIQQFKKQSYGLIKENI